MKIQFLLLVHCCVCHTWHCPPLLAGTHKTSNSVCDIAPLSPSPFSCAAFCRSAPWRHSAVRHAAKCVDVRHSCGFLSLLYTGTEQARSLVSSHINNIQRTLSSGQGRSVPSANPPSPSPKRISSSDKTLSVDDLLSLEVVNPGSGSDTPAGSETPLSPLPFSQANGATSEPVETESDWVPLDLCFGVPLFDADLNKKILEKVGPISIDRAIMVLSGYAMPVAGCVPLCTETNLLVVRIWCGAGISL